MADVQVVATGTLAENASASTTLNVPYPTISGGILSTDRLVLWMAVNSFTASTNPSGYTLHIESAAATASPTTTLRSKFAAGGETGSLAVTTPSATSKGMFLLLRNVDPTTPVDATPTEIERGAGSTNYNIPGQTISTTGACLIYGAASNTTTGTFSTPTVPATFTEVIDDPSPSPHAALGYLIWLGSGSTGTIDLTRSSSIRGGAFLVAFRPTASTTQHPLTGTVASSTGSSGSVALRAGVAGTVAAATAVAGTITGLYPLTGTAPSTTNVTGSPTALKPLTGSTAATTAATGSPQARLGLSGTVAATSSTAGDIGSQAGVVQHPLEGTVAASSGTSGTIALIAALSGSVQATTTAAGSPGALLGLTGTTAAQSDVTGAPTAILGLAGSVGGQSDTAGDIGVIDGSDIPGPDIGQIAATPPPYTAVAAPPAYVVTANPPAYEATAAAPRLISEAP